jgi:peptide/nickel transport system permease protein
MRKFGDITMAVPSFLWALAFMATTGPGILNVTVALILVSWPYWARLIDSMLTQEETKGYVDSAIAIGLSRRQIYWRHILPNIMPVIFAQLPIQIAHMILVFAGLSFLGYGAPPDVPEWGRMIYEGKDFMTAWWITLFPGLAIFFSVLALQMLKPKT